MAACTVRDCDRKTVAKGLCKLHYYRLRRNGTVELPTLSLPSWATEADIAWAAGFIDADGSILIERSKHTYGGARRLRFTPRICGGSIDMAPLLELQALFGGNICQQRHTHLRVGGPQHTRCFYQWQITSARAIDVARMLMPYLRIKNLQAYVLSCFEHEAIWTKGGADSQMPREEIARREALVEEIRSYNDRSHAQEAEEDARVRIRERQGVFSDQ